MNTFYDPIMISSSLLNRSLAYDKAKSLWSWPFDNHVESYPSFIAVWVSVYLRNQDNHYWRVLLTLTPNLVAVIARAVNQMPFLKKEEREFTRERRKKQINNRWLLGGERKGWENDVVVAWGRPSLQPHDRSVA